MNLLPLAQLGGHIDVEMVAAIIAVIFLAIGIHEYCHAKFADLAGDPTPRAMGRVTLNLFKHFELLGSIMILITALAGYGIGWGKPVMMDPRRMKNPKWDHFIAVLAGPMSNLVQAAVFAVLLRLVGAYVVSVPFLLYFLFFGVMINVSLFVFNLIPIGPLDGMWLLGTFMPDKTRLAWTRFNLTIGQFVFLGLVLIRFPDGSSPLSIIMGPLRSTLARVLLGHDLGM
ncbi:MAG: site-2 protease family protein [Armatimonadetes bacterium]|nr:site-2 protease family protein [Armatimonadota bacterium]